MTPLSSDDPTFGGPTQANDVLNPSGSDYFAGVVKNVLYIVIGILGLCSNGFVILVIAKTPKMRKSFSNLFVINQSVIDFCASVFLIFDTTSFALGVSFEGLAGELTCRLWSSAFLLWGTFISSTYNLVLISVERYLGVCHPIWHLKRFTKKIAFGCMFAPVIAGFAIEMFIPLVTRVVNGQCVLYQFPSKLAQKSHGVFIFVIDFLFPLGIMVFCYVSMTRRLSSETSTMSQMAKRAQMNVLKTLVVVCSCFGLCHVTSQVIYLSFNLGYPIDFHAWYYYMGVIAVNVNCCVNPFIYAFKYEDFRRGMKRIFCRSTSVGQGSSTTGSSVIGTGTGVIG